MADYPHALLVEFGPNSVPKLKNKLTKYFQSRRARGGDCTVDMGPEKQSALLRFRSQQDQRNVLEKEEHLLRLDSGHLKLTVKLLSEKQEFPADQDKAEPASPPEPTVLIPVSRASGHGEEEEGSLPASLPSPSSSPSDTPPLSSEPLLVATEAPLLSTASVLGNLAAAMMEEFVEMLVENIMKGTVSEGLTVEMIPALKSAVVAFQTEQENAMFIHRCPDNRLFKSKALTVRPLAPPTQLLLEGIGLDEDLLRLFFDKEEAEVEKVEFREERQDTIISFKSAKDVQRLLQKPLTLRKKRLKPYPFYPCLGRALYGSDRPPLRLPPPVVHPADPALLKFISGGSSYLQTLQTQLKSHWCQAALDQNSVRLSPEPELLQQEETVLMEWSATVRSVVTLFLSQFEVCALKPPPDLWKNSVDNISILLTSHTQVIMVPNEADAFIKVVGPTLNIANLREPLCESINSLIKRARREKTQVTDEIKVPMSVFNLLSRDGLQQQLLTVYPEIMFDTCGDYPSVTGLTEEIAATSKIIYEKMLDLSRRDVEADSFLVEFLKGEEQERRVNAMLSQKNAVFKISGNKFQFMACSDEDLDKAEGHLQSLFVSDYVKAEDANVLKSIEWQQLVDQIKSKNNIESKKVQIKSENDKVIVSGFKETVTSVSNKLDSFLKQNAQVKESVIVNPIAKLEYLQEIARAKLDALQVNVVVTFTKNGLSLDGTRANVKDCVGEVKKLIDSVAFESITIVKHGARKVFEDKEENYQMTIANKTGCLVKIVDIADTEQGLFSASSFRKPVYKIQTPNGVEIFVANADMCSYPVHAIVSAAVVDLKLKSGLAAALLKAVGPQLKVECDRIHASKGNLNPGDCEVTNAGGSLTCLKIIHAVGPNYKQPNAQKDLERAVKRSLELADQHQCQSLAIPAISRNRNFPLNECAQIIVKAVKDYCNQSSGKSNLTSVHLVNNDDSAVKAMVDAVKKEFEDKGVSVNVPVIVPRSGAPKQPSAASSSSAPPVSAPPVSALPVSVPAPVPAPVDLNCVGKELTKEGLELSVIKGHLESAMTDVIVNSVVSNNLDLSHGAVSKAILTAAGPSLQAMVLAKQSQAAVGDVVVTEGANLNCQMVYHARVPSYDKGQGTAQKQLSGIFSDCLSKAESSGMTSISFSAIGTGNLGFPRDLVWTLLLQNVLDISSKKPKNLKRVQVVLFPGDTKTIQVFSDEFQKKFPKAAGSSTAAPSSAGELSKVLSSSSSHETKMGGVSVQVVTGDITKETTDVIINSTNENFSLKSGVSKAILEAAGPSVVNDCQTLGAQANTGMILTQPGSLRCKKILHLVGQTDLAKIQAAVRDALLLCIKNNFSSVAFPAIGTGQGNVGARGVADAMFDAVKDVVTKNPSSSMKIVKVVIFQSQMLKDFHDSLQQRVAPDAKEREKTKESSMLGNLASKFKSFFVPTSPQTTQVNQDFEMEPIKATPLCFHICGENVQKINAAKKKIDSILSKTLQSNTIKDETVLSLSADDHRRLADIQRSTGVGIHVQSANNQGCITVEGLAADVLSVSNQIHEMLKVARHEEDLNQKALLLSAVVEWQFAQQGQNFQSFDPKTSYELEQGLEHKLKEVKIKLNGQDFTVKMPKGPATNRSGASVVVQRINKMSDQPESWEAMTSSSTKAFTLSQGSAEFIEVQQLFNASCNRTITKIERIQNPVLWQSLQIKRKAMEQRNGHSRNERRLFHGTSEDTVAFINEHGFNRSYAGKNATAYGKGTYFAVQAQYSSSDTYSRPSANGDKFMYLCSVLTGDFTQGAGGMIEPPLKKSGSIERFDSVVDNPSRPSMFIIFHDSHAYPEYLITFR